ncbi:unnamed protein product [Jaminaea pallidilutea]
MALVIVSGLPSSGRTSRSKELIADWQRRIDGNTDQSAPRRIVHLTDDSLHLPKTVYGDQSQEKPARASYLSLVSRSLAKGTIVVADGGAGLNIKGFRYQLWCAAREVGLMCLGVLVTARKETCTEWNSRRPAPEQYDEATLKDLMMRFEEPNPMTRWDSPLFVLPSEVVGGGVEGVELDVPEPPFDAIWQTIVSGKATRAPPVVANRHTTSTNYLSVLESTSQSVVAAILEQANSVGLPEGGGQVLIAPAEGQRWTLRLPEGKRVPTPAQWQRLRRQFVKMHSAGFASGNSLGQAATDEGGKAGAGAADALTQEQTVQKRFVGFLEEMLPTL